MAYLPPHKRHADSSSSSSKPTPTPCSLIPKFKQSLTLTKPKRSSNVHGTKIIYATNSISRWWPAGSAVEDPIPDSTRLEPFDCEAIERRDGAKPMVIAGEVEVQEDKPWVRIAERLLPDLVETAKRAVEVAEMESGREVVKLMFVARIGKVLFHGNSSDIETVREAAAAEAVSRSKLHKSFYNNVPGAYKDNIMGFVVPKLGFEFESEKENYIVKVFDKCNPKSTISCKCVLVKDTQELHIRKVELDNVRQLVADISCLTKDLDLRLMLNKQRMLKTMDDEESNGINKLVSSAVIDPDVKGGLRWPLGKESVAERFTIVGAWHTKSKVFESQTMRLKLKKADRFDHRTSVGEVTDEVTLKLTEISKHLREDNIQDDFLGKKIEESVELIWNNFLTSSHNSG